MSDIDVYSTKQGKFVTYNIHPRIDIGSLENIISLLLV